MFSSQHFELIQYVNGLFKFLLIFQVMIPKLNKNSFLESRMQQPPIQLSQLITCFYWNENFDYVLMKILKNNWDSPLEYVVSSFNTSHNTTITKNKLEIVLNIYKNN
jgi:hypothetical protein